MTKYIPYLLYFWLIAMHKVFLSDLTSIFNVKINMVTLIVVLVAIHKTEITAVWFGSLAGLVAYIGMGSFLPWQVIILGLIGLLTFHFKERLNLESIFAKVLLLFCAVLVHNIILMIKELNSGYLTYFAQYALTGAVYTTVIGWIFFLFKDERITVKKIKSIF